jgi:hypothetical protein
VLEVDATTSSSRLFDFCFPVFDIVTN